MSILDLIDALGFAKDASNMAGKAKDDPPGQRKWRWIAVVLILMLVAVSLILAFIDVG